MATDRRPPYVRTISRISETLADDGATKKASRLRETAGPIRSLGAR
jgi:hypothetical protein